jgi:hypothetical protein
MSRLFAATALRTTRDALELPLGHGENLRTWLYNRAPADLDVRRLLKARLGKAPYVEDLDKQLQDEGGPIFEHWIDGRLALAAGTAAEQEAPCVSLAGAATWSTPHLTLTRKSMGEDCELVCNVAQVLHASELAHVQVHAPTVRQRNEDAASSGDMLWRTRDVLFPHLVFCPSVEDDLEHYPADDAGLRAVKRLLRALNQAAGAGRGADAVAIGVLAALAESKATMQHPKYGKMREFKDEMGVTHVCEAHVKQMGQNLRIHFKWLADRRVSLIGYVGKHLPTVEYGT